jgi:hypothetical protein
MKVGDGDPQRLEYLRKCDVNAASPAHQYLLDPVVFDH